MTRRRGLAILALCAFFTLSGLGVWGGRKYAASLPPAPDGVPWILWAKLDVQTEKADGRMVFEWWEWEPSEGFLSNQECMEELRNRMPEDFKVQPIYHVCLPDTIKDPRPRAEQCREAVKEGRAPAGELVRTCNEEGLYRAPDGRWARPAAPPLDVLRARLWLRCASTPKRFDDLAAHMSGFQLVVKA